MRSVHDHINYRIDHLKSALKKYLLGKIAFCFAMIDSINILGKMISMLFNKRHFDQF